MVAHSDKDFIKRRLSRKNIKFYLKHQRTGKECTSTRVFKCSSVLVFWKTSNMVKSLIYKLQFNHLTINLYEPQGKPWTHISGQSPEELNLSFPSAEAEREDGSKNPRSRFVSRVSQELFILWLPVNNHFPNKPFTFKFE